MKHAIAAVLLLVFAAPAVAHAAKPLPAPCDTVVSRTVIQPKPPAPAPCPLPR